MADPKMDYDPIEQWDNTTIFPDNPTDIEVRPMFSRLFTQIQTFINTTLIAWIKDTFTTVTQVLTRTNTDIYTPTLSYHPSTKKYVDDTVVGVALGQIPSNSLTEVQMANDMKKGIVGGVESYDDAAAHLADNTPHGEIANMYRSGKDANGIYTTLQYKRVDGTLFKDSILSGGTSPNYTTRTVKYYALNGATVLLTKVYTLSYTGADIISEVTS